METFELRIEMGNDAMKYPRDVAFALRRLADKIADEHDYDSGPIRDNNGNTVGRYGFDLGLLIPEQGVTRVPTDDENVFKVAVFNAAKAVVDRQPAQAREWLEVAKHARELQPLGGVVPIEINDGDTLVLETNAKLTVDDMVGIKAQVREELGDDVKVLIFGGSHVVGVVAKP